MRFIQYFTSLFISIACVADEKMSDLVELDYANNFRIENFQGYKMLNVLHHSRDSMIVQRYALVPKTEAIPDIAEGIPIIRTPVQRVVVMETVFIGYLDALEQLNTIVGAATVEFISQTEIREKIMNQEISALQSGKSLNIEDLLLLEPDIILTSISGDPRYDLPQKLLRSNLPIIITSGHLENHPLALAEWIKFISCFLELENHAEAIFDESSRQYEELVELAKLPEEKPTVFFGAPYSGAWFIPGGESITSQAVKDAGGRYIWACNESRGSIALDVEGVFLKAHNADFWINPSLHRSLDALRGADSRFEKFSAFQREQIYNNTKQVLESGGNNIWERGIVYPHEALADLIHILHPQLLPQHEPTYFEPLK